MMDDGNGGEYRKTFHGYAPPFAQLVESPTVINGIAMQVRVCGCAGVRV